MCPVARILLYGALIKIYVQNGILCILSRIAYCLWWKMDCKIYGMPKLIIDFLFVKMSFAQLYAFLIFFFIYIFFFITDGRNKTFFVDPCKR